MLRALNFAPIYTSISECSVPAKSVFTQAQKRHLHVLQRRPLLFEQISQPCSKSIDGHIVPESLRTVRRLICRTQLRGRLHTSCRKTAASGKVGQGKEHVKEIISSRGPKLVIGSGKLARLADGTAVAKIGNTSVMATVVSKGKQSTQGFLPLTVDYRQKAAAAGRIPTNHLRRELGPTEREILAGRMIDRSVRPLFLKGFNVDTGVNCNLLSVDAVNDPVVISINATSAALSLSDIPWGPAVGAVRMGMIGDKFIVNPTRKELVQSNLNLVLAGTDTGEATMLEGEAKCLPHDKFLEAVKIGLEECSNIAKNIRSMSDEVGKEKRANPCSGSTLHVSDSTDILAEQKDMISVLCSGQLRSIYTDYTLDKQSRDSKMFQLRDNVISKIRELKPAWDPVVLNELFSSLSKDLVRSLIFDENIRVDGRSPTDIRPISCEVNLHAPLHGSALFQRGQTQVFCTVALDSLHSALKLDPMSVLTGGVKEKNFLLHYEFPSYATGEVGRSQAHANRRELGHGALAEKAIRQVLPGDQDFTIRLTSEVLESNGSSSMASVCGGSLALLDAGIGLTEMASGVAMGLVTREAGDAVERKVLTDLMGMEDYLGDMDFKLAATRNGVVGIQADVKLPTGISYDVIQEAVEGAMDGNHRILNVMEECLAAPRQHKSCWPVSKRLEVPPHKRGRFLGPAGLNVRRITNDTGVQLWPEEEGVWQMFAPSPEAMTEAEQAIEDILKEEKVPELEFGAIYTGKITEILDRGVMIQLHENLSPVLLHNSQISGRKISHPSALGLKVGQDLQVKYYGRDPASGQIRLSRKVLTQSSAAAVRDLHKATRRKDEDGPGKGGSNPPEDGMASMEPQRSDLSRSGQVQIDSKDGNQLKFKPQLVINENRRPDPYLSFSRVGAYPNDGGRQPEISTLSTKDLFIRKSRNETIESSADRTPRASEDVGESDLLPEDQSSSETLFSTKGPPTRSSTPSNELQESQNNTESKVNEAELVYYKIDRMVNELVNINMEINEAKQRKEESAAKSAKLKSKLQFLTKPSYSTKMLSDAFYKETLEDFRQSTSQTKAIDETIRLLQRQLDMTKHELEAAKRSYLQLSSSSNNALDSPPVVTEESPSLNVQLKTAERTEEAFDSESRWRNGLIEHRVEFNEENLNKQHNDDSERAIIHASSDYNQVQPQQELPERQDHVIERSPTSSAPKAAPSKSMAPGQFSFNPSLLMNRDQWSLSTIGKYFARDQKTEAESKADSKGLPISKEDHSVAAESVKEKTSSSMDDSAIPPNGVAPEADIHRIDEKRTASSTLADLKRIISKTGNLDELDKLTESGNGTNSIFNSNANTNTNSRTDSLLQRLETMQVDKPVRWNRFKGRRASTPRARFASRRYNIDQKEFDLMQLSEKLSNKERILPNVEVDETALNTFVQNSVNDFLNLLSWLNDLESRTEWNQWEIDNVTSGIEIVHRNLMSNLNELNYNQRFITYHKSGVEFISRYLDRADHVLILQANALIEQLEQIYDANVQMMGNENSTIITRQDLTSKELWSEYHKIRIQLKQVKNRLWEVELSEERLADLHEWREMDPDISAKLAPGDDSGSNLKEISDGINKAQEKIKVLCKEGIDRNWTSMEKEYQNLQRLEVEGLTQWLRKDSLPTWLSPQLKDHLLQRCEQYEELDKRRKDLKSWKVFSPIPTKNEDVDLNLEVLHSQIRSCLAKVKYTSVENSRHKAEIHVYATWLQQFGSTLRSHSSKQLEDLIDQATSKVEEVDQALTIYVGVLSSSSQAYSREAAKILDRMREEKRVLMKEIVNVFIYACKEIKFQGVDSLNYLVQD